MRFFAAVASTVCLSAMLTFASAASAQDARVRSFTEESRRLAFQVSRDYRDQMLREMKLSGPVRAIVACRYACPDILSTQSRKTGWRVAKVSLKPRNSALGMPDEWEQKVLIEFNRRAANGEDPNALEFAEIVKEPQAGYFRYARAIVVESLCLQCHGPRDKLKDVVKIQLARDYPFDKAVNFSLGEVQGIVSIKRDF